DQPGGRRRRRLGGHETLVLAVRIEEEAAFLHAPAVVAARLDDVDLLDVVLARVADPQLVGFGIDRYPERIPESVRVDFLRDFGLPGERIRRRNPVPAVRGVGPERVDPQDRAEGIAEALPVAAVD